MSRKALTALPVLRFGAPLSLLGSLNRLIQLHAGRQALARLEGHLLSDVGLDRDQAVAEARRPIWDVPQTWLR
jgi:uncharacterized protein YjiS (DUF1127 family)